MSLDTFRRITGQRGIRPRIAAQAYDLLLPVYSSTMRARLDDRLVEDLHLTPSQVQDLYGNLLYNTDRNAPVGDPPTILTVMDLLNAVQSAPRQSLVNSVVRPVARLSGFKNAQRTRMTTDEESRLGLARHSQSPRL